MTATLRFTLPEDEDRFRQALNGAKWESVLWVFCETWLRPIYKHQTQGDAWASCAAAAREEIARLMAEHGVEFAP